MEFVITRTSASDDKIPCEDERLNLSQYYHIDERTCADVSEFGSLKGASEERITRERTMWFGRGKNHRVESGHMKRDIPDTGWIMELNNLEELATFVKEHGECVVSVDNGSIPEIEIYDDYRE